MKQIDIVAVMQNQIVLPRFHKQHLIIVHIFFHFFRNMQHIMQCQSTIPWLFTVIDDYGDHRHKPVRLLHSGQILIRLHTICCLILFRIAVVLFFICAVIISHDPYGHGIMDMLLTFQTQHDKFYSMCSGSLLYLYVIPGRFDTLCIFSMLQNDRLFRVHILQLLRPDHRSPVKKNGIEKICKLIIIAPVILQYSIRLQVLCLRHTVFLSLTDFSILLRCPHFKPNSRFSDKQPFILSI